MSAFLGGFGPATADHAGTESAAEAAAFLGTAPTDPTDAIATTGATGTYSEGTVSNVVSTIDPTITTIAYARCHSLGHVGTGKLVPFLFYPGFGQAATTQISQTMRRRIADFVDPASGRAPFCLPVNGRGHNGSGTIDYARDSYDRHDALVAAIAAVGASNFATSGCVRIGFSTGCAEAILDACRFPDETIAVVLVYPNFDLGADPGDGYWALSNTARGSGLTAGVGDRAQGAAAAVDPYIARNGVDAIARIVALPGGPHVWILGDRTEAPTVPICSPDRLARALQEIPAAAAKTHVHITQSGDANRILHNTDFSGSDVTGGTLYAERYWVPTVLANAADWLMPRKSPAGDLRLLGWMKTRSASDRPGFEVWTGPNTAPRSAAGAGGRLHAGEFFYDDIGKRFRVTAHTSQNGYLEVLRDSEDRSVALTAGTPCQVDLNVSAVITAMTDLAYTHEFRADAGVTEGGGAGTGVTAWADQIGALSATEGTNKPALTTDADGKLYIGFTAASSHKLVISSLAVDPTQDFTIAVVANKTDTAQGWILALSHHGSLAELNLNYSSAVDSVSYVTDANGNALSANVGGHTWSQNAKHLLMLMRKSGVLYESMDGSPWSKANITDSFTTSGSNTTSFGAGWANGAGAYWKFLTGRIHNVALKQAASGDSEPGSVWALMKTRWTF
jgi:hypothetical protein